MGALKDISGGNNKPSGPEGGEIGAIGIIFWGLLGENMVCQPGDGEKLGASVSQEGGFLKF